MSTGMPSYASASLYVGDLAPDVTEGLLFEIFNQVGPVVSIRVCRDNVTRRSLGYAYVNFHSVIDAERALDTMNNTLIKSRPCRIMWSQRDPSVRKSGVGNIFIKNLAKEIDHKSLQDTFSAFGNILSCKVALDENNNSLGYGFVHYDTAEAAKKAIEKVNGMSVKGEIVYVGPFIPRKDRARGPGGEKKFTNIYVKNLPNETTEESLKTLFADCGNITNCVVKYHEGDKSKAFGFVNFEKPEEAKKAVDDFNDKEIDGKKLYVSRAQKKSEREAELRARVEQWKMDRMTKYKGVNLYVKNLEDTVDDEQLRTEFAHYGTITSAKVMRDEKGHSKGFGFVCFSTPEEATRAVTEMAGRMIGNKPLYVALAQPKSMRRAQLEAQHAQRQKGGGRGGPGMNPAMYGAGPSPVFYAQPGSMPPQQGYVYPGQMMPRRNWSPQAQYPVPNYVVPMNQRGQAAGGRGRPQKGGNPAANGAPRRTGPRDQAQAPQAAQAQAAQAQAGEAPEFNRQTLENYSPEQQHHLLGERLYPLVHKVQPEHAPKITGMLLDSHYQDEIFHFLEDPDALRAKIDEAVTVLEQARANEGDESAPAATAEASS